MSEIEKIELVLKMISDNSITSETVEAYLSLASQRILDKLYPFGTKIKVFPSRYDHLQCELAVRMIARQGGEGEIAHSENGISRTWANTDDEDLLTRVTPVVGVFGC